MRASRSLPFMSKVMGVNFVEMATRVFVGEKVKPITIDVDNFPYVGVKSPQVQH